MKTKLIFITFILLVLPSKNTITQKGYNKNKTLSKLPDDSFKEKL